MGKFFGFIDPVLLFDEGAGGGQQQTPEKDGDGAGDQGQGKKPDGDGDKKPDGEKRFSQAELDAIIEDRLERAKKTAEKTAEQARKKADEENLAKNAEWKTLAEKRAGELEAINGQLAELESLRAREERYGKVLKQYAKTQIEALPKPVQSLLEKMDPAEQLDWIAANAKELNIKTPSGLPETPDPSDKASEAQKEAARKQFAQAVRKF